MDGIDPATVAKRWPKLSAAQQQAIIRVVIDRIEVGPGTVGKRFDPIAEAMRGLIK